MLATNPPVIKISKRVRIQQTSNSDIISIQTKLYNGQERAIHLSLDELKAILKAVSA